MRHSTTTMALLSTSTSRLQFVSCHGKQPRCLWPHAPITLVVGYARYASPKESANQTPHPKDTAVAAQQLLLCPRSEDGATFCPSNIQPLQQARGLAHHTQPAQARARSQTNHRRPLPKPTSQGLLCAFSCFRFEIIAASSASFSDLPHRVHLTSRCVVALLHEERSRSSAKDGRLFAWRSRGLLGRVGLVADSGCRLQRLRVAVAGGG